MNKKGFYVQMHLHTAETSGCGRASAVEMVHACKAAGYDLIAVTDHFFNANIGCDPDLPWLEQIEYLFRGYYAAKAEGDRIGLEVIRGWETFTTAPGLQGPELLTYGLDEAFLMDNPDIADIDYYEYIRRVNQAGGKIIHAHPYRRAPYIPNFTPDPLSVEAYEVYNGHNKNPDGNRLAYREAVAYGLMQFAGADAHTTSTVTSGAMRFEHPVHDIYQIFQAVKNGQSQILEKMPYELY